MRSPRDTASAVPASLAALAESGILFVVVRNIAEHEGHVTTGIMAHFPLFAAVFVAGVAAATVFRRSLVAKAAIPAVAIVLGLVQGTAWSTGEYSGTATVVILSLLVAFRVTTLAIRDWREPAGFSFGVGTVALLAEVAVISKEDPVWGLLPVITVVFFAGMLASRAASVWLVSRREATPVGAPVSRPHRSAVVLLGVMGAMLGVTVLLGVPGGAFQVSGGFLYRWIAEGLAYLAALIAAVLAPPISWLLGLVDLHVRPQNVERAVNRIKPKGGHAAGGPGIERIIGLAIFIAIFLLLVWMIWRRWKQLLPKEPEVVRVEPQPDLGVIGRRPRRRRGARLRRELPADTVRRWYAEALLALERLNLPKSPSRTPGEYLPVVTGAFPESARGFTALTRAYERVRYGSVVLDQEAVWRLEVERDQAMEALGRARRIDDPGQA
jgi:hypothetical protein